MFQSRAVAWFGTPNGNSRQRQLVPFSGRINMLVQCYCQHICTLRHLSLKRRLVATYCLGPDLLFSLSWTHPEPRTDCLSCKGMRQISWGHDPQRPSFSLFFSFFPSISIAHVYLSSAQYIYTLTILRGHALSSIRYFSSPRPPVLQLFKAM